MEIINTIIHIATWVSLGLFIEGFMDDFKKKHINNDQ